MANIAVNDNDALELLPKKLQRDILLIKNLFIRQT